MARPTKCEWLKPVSFNIANEGEIWQESPFFSRQEPIKRKWRLRQSHLALAKMIVGKFNKYLFQIQTTVCTINSSRNIIMEKDLNKRVGWACRLRRHLDMMLHSIPRPEFDSLLSKVVPKPVVAPLHIQFTPFPKSCNFHLLISLLLFLFTKWFAKK